MTAGVSQARAAKVFDALGEPHRLRIVTGLCRTGPRSTLQVAQSLTMSRQATTKHLELLQAAGVVSSAKSGRERIWTVEPQPLSAAGDYLAALSARWDGALARLQAFVDDGEPPNGDHR
ncbi:ArsR/SmtB family transcription factor [Mycolicibacterium litorale]|uniref:Transcriptional regulator n=1 Tax=Mycolicibacterium litorale TaxID=758802 RepID=A0AAD1IP93_9MYCO|nr:metalloregulator ArsR/SmtB family transcription factor [Mycolicibacterium litorale]MCV7415917.1 helix-turn-helix transcriptional regulator [Mycolicibacterium litorale]TDY09169.1 ArsR family transcriptional regulator [Mycolicibacterium litorale]BBY17107.1 transcriptional regulator [Mycolicibacterium litorale]